MFKAFDLFVLLCVYIFLLPVYSAEFCAVRGPDHYSSHIG